MKSKFWVMDLKTTVLVTTMAQQTQDYNKLRIVNVKSTLL